MMTVAIHTYPGSVPFRAYLLWHLAREWRQAGLRVEVVTGVRPVPEARIGMLHVDLTRVPDEYTALSDVYPVLLNGGVLDIGKRLFAELRVYRDDPYEGPVIVKTDLNARGIPERIAARAAQRLPARVWSTVLDYAFPQRPTGRMWLGGEGSSYPVFRNTDAVPGWVWRSSDVVVQRFLPERLQGKYARRHWTFFGDHEVTTIEYASLPTFPPGALEGSEPNGSVPPPLHALRATRGVDFGAFDYILHDGRPLVLDVNKTPAYAPGTRLAYLAPADVSRLARGIERWL